MRHAEGAVAQPAWVWVEKGRETVYIHLNRCLLWTLLTSNCLCTSSHTTEISVRMAAGRGGAKQISGRASRAVSILSPKRAREERNRSAIATQICASFQSLIATRLLLDSTWISDVYLDSWSLVSLPCHRLVIAKDAYVAGASRECDHRR